MEIEEGKPTKDILKKKHVANWPENKMMQARRLEPSTAPPRGPRPLSLINYFCLGCQKQHAWLLTGSTGRCVLCSQEYKSGSRCAEKVQTAKDYLGLAQL